MCFLWAASWMMHIASCWCYQFLYLLCQFFKVLSLILMLYAIASRWQHSILMRPRCCGVWTTHLFFNSKLVFVFGWIHGWVISESTTTAHVAAGASEFWTLAAAWTFVGFDATAKKQMWRETEIMTGKIRTEKIN